MALNDRLLQQRTLPLLFSLKHQYNGYLTCKIKFKAEECAFNCPIGGQVAETFILFQMDMNLKGLETTLSLQICKFSNYSA